MKLSLFALSILASSYTMASEFKVRNPVEETKEVLVPLDNLTCERGRFYSANLKLVLPAPLGNAGQTGTLRSPSGGLDIPECSTIINELRRNEFAHGVYKFVAKILTRKVIRYTSPTASACEGALQEIVTVKIQGIDLTESVYQSESELPCPGRAESRDHVIYVLHEDGVPSDSNF